MLPGQRGALVLDRSDLRHLGRPGGVLILSRAAAAGLFAAAVLALGWNVYAFDWRKSYDAGATTLYIHTLREEHRLPDERDTTVWHNPPLFFAAAGLAQAVAEPIGLRPQRGVQLLSAAAVASILAFVYLISRELFPASRAVPTASLAVAATTPVLLRAGALYHPEALAGALTTGGVYVLIRALARNSLSVRAGIGAGALLGLANLTRTWALAALAAALVALGLHAWWQRSRNAAAMLLGVVSAAGVLVTPWLVYKTIEHGSPLAYSRPVPSQWLDPGRPAAFFVSLPLRELADRPYAPHLTNRLLPVVYSDWWGDYWRSWEVPEELHNEPARLPERFARTLRLQSLFGIVPTAAALLGFCALGAVAVRARQTALLALLLAGALLAVSFVAFLIRYAKVDGDNIKALYLLNGVPVFAVCSGWALAWVARRHPLLRAGVLAALLAAFAATLAFILLPV